MGKYLLCGGEACISYRSAYRVQMLRTCNLQGLTHGSQTAVAERSGCSDFCVGCFRDASCVMMLPVPPKLCTATVSIQTRSRSRTPPPPSPLPNPTRQPDSRRPPHTTSPWQRATRRLKCVWLWPGDVWLSRLRKCRHPSRTSLSPAPSLGSCRGAPPLPPSPPLLSSPLLPSPSPLLSPHSPCHVRTRQDMSAETEVVLLWRRW